MRIVNNHARSEIQLAHVRIGETFWHGPASLLYLRLRTPNMSTMNPPDGTCWCADLGDGSLVLLALDAPVLPADAAVAVASDPPVRGGD